MAFILTRHLTLESLRGLFLRGGGGWRGGWRGGGGAQDTWRREKPSQAARGSALRFVVPCDQHPSRTLSQNTVQVHQLGGDITAGAVGEGVGSGPVSDPDTNKHGAFCTQTDNR